MILKSKGGGGKIVVQLKFNSIIGDEKVFDEIQIQKCDKVLNGNRIDRIIKRVKTP